MNIEQLRDYCLSKKGVTDGFPFDEDVLVFKVLNKMFLLTSLKNWEEGIQFLNLKCNEDYAQELREEYESIEPGWHMSKKLWNSVYIYKGELKTQFIFELIDHSYDMVLKTLPKKVRDNLK
ncbi:MmcQ/YjbR family DNA-binding protein [Olleya sp. AH-315-F22]|nr:MmcQ/YjbR family DNA-binding protein [Olleya sp. AH-315-F22]